VRERQVSRDELGNNRGDERPDTTPTAPYKWATMRQGTVTVGFIAATPRSDKASRQNYIKF